MPWDTLPSKERIENTIAALGEHGIEVFFFEEAGEGKSRVLEMLPEGAEVINMTSMTLAELGLDKEIMESGRYDSVKKRLMGMDRATQNRQMQMLGAAPAWSVSSVHVLTETGSVMIASNTGSQLPASMYGADHVIWVVGAQKIVADIEEGFKRIYEWCLPHERERALKAYGPGTTSHVNKVLIVNGEKQADRIKIVLINKVLGF
ncbi:MAG TPA: LUD domain-containing protein [Candidatus Anoxymicrobiaceae bacterium]